MLAFVVGRFNEQKTYDHVNMIHNLNKIQTNIIFQFHPKTVSHCFSLCHTTTRMRRCDCFTIADIRIGGHIRCGI